MKLPFNFEQFKENPITAITLVLVIVVGYLYIDNKAVHKAQLEDHKERIESLEAEGKLYEYKLEKINQKLLECLGSN